MKRAIALRYDALGLARSDGGDADADADESASDAPVVVCAGEGEHAERIERTARDHGVVVVRDVPLCDALAELRVGEPIPEALYEAVAAILREIAG